MKIDLNSPVMIFLPSFHQSLLGIEHSDRDSAIHKLAYNAQDWGNALLLKSS